MFWLHRHLPAKHVLNSKQSAKGYLRIIREFLRSGYFSSQLFALFVFFFVAHCVESPQKLAHRISSTSLCTSTIIIKTLWICNCYSMRPLHQTTEGQKQRETGMGRGRNKVQNSYFSLSSDASVIWNGRFRFFEVASSSRLFFHFLLNFWHIWWFLQLKHRQSWKCCKTLKNNRIHIL